MKITAERLLEIAAEEYNAAGLEAREEIRGYIAEEKELAE